MLQFKGTTRTNREVFHDVAVTIQFFWFCFCLFGFIFAALCHCGPSNLLRRPPTLLLWPPPICGALLVVYMPVALRAGASALLDWMHSYSVCRVGVGTGACCKRACCKHACCKLGTLASMASNF